MEHIEIGEVVQVFHETVQIRIEQQENCKACGAKSSCHSNASDNLKEKFVTALDPFGLKVGQRVKINLDSKNLVKASIIIFGLPLIGFFLGVAAGTFIANMDAYKDYVDLCSIIGGFSGMAIAIIILRIYNKKLEKSNKFYPNVVELI